MRLATKAVLAWLALLVVMFGNGTVRVLVLEPRLGSEAARQVASVAGVLIVVAAGRAFVARAGGVPSRALGAVGLLWTALTLAFELLFGHFVAGASWPELLADYDVGRGRLWPLVLLATALAPWAWGRVLEGRRTRVRGRASAPGRSA
jgi:hypothetical protein